MLLLPFMSHIYIYISILGCQSLIKTGIRWSLCSGKDIKFWEDIGLTDFPFNESVNLFEIISILMSKSLVL